MTSDRQPPVNVASVATGLCFVGLGVVLLLQRSGVVQLEQILELWPVVLIVLGASVAWQASRGGAVSNVGAGVAGLVWLLILGIFFSYVFDRRSHGPDGPGEISAFAVLGGDDRPVADGAFKGGQVTTVMGGAKVDLRAAQLDPGETAVIDVFGMMSGTEIRVPPHWTVSFETTTIMAGTSDERRPGTPDDAGADAAATPEGSVESAAPNPAASALPPPRLVVQGIVVMSGVTVK